MVPVVGSTNRLIIRSVVVFPHPEGPTRTVVSPRFMSRDRSLTAGRAAPGKVFPTETSEIMGCVMGPLSNDGRPQGMPGRAWSPNDRPDQAALLIGDGHRASLEQLEQAVQVGHEVLP